MYTRNLPNSDIWLYNERRFNLRINYLRLGQVWRHRIYTIWEYKIVHIRESRLNKIHILHTIDELSKVIFTEQRSDYHFT